MNRIPSAFTLARSKRKLAGSYFACVFACLFASSSATSNINTSTAVPCTVVVAVDALDQLPPAVEVLGLVVEPDVQPGDPTAVRAQPEAAVAPEPRLGRGADAAPEREDLERGRNDVRSAQVG